VGQPNVPECAGAIPFLLFLSSKHSQSGWFSSLVHNGWGCDQFGGAGLGINPPLKLFLRADPPA